ncbi:coiled-coil domain-containing protein 171 isoform X1 [Tachyglossus aculeatus]|uniref:coiled-coil domain-containing protein 171 isoform X1 n=1 Tax=Tachyglossus aculeatus TaxID=9261 RepID=UPI0018F374E9|nr:coiled-coil domain-containing protein 171 isoform X1 [Tachyglossus aculeatus]XP_038625843.1 coiled-coil domain-containing protein 171 isoform X1 [Tachyglossus aculeatus]
MSKDKKRGKMCSNYECNIELLKCKNEIALLQNKLEKEEALRERLRSELTLVLKIADFEKMELEKQLSEANSYCRTLVSQKAELQTKAYEAERAFHASQQKRQEEARCFEEDLEKRDNLIRIGRREYDLLLEKKNKIERAFKIQEHDMHDLHRRIRHLGKKCDDSSDILLHQTSELKSSIEREKHLEREYLLHIEGLQEELQTERASHAEAVYDLEIILDEFAEFENVYETEKRNAQVSTLQLQRKEKEFSDTNKQQNEKIEEQKKVITDLSRRLQNNEKCCDELQEELVRVKRHQTDLLQTRENDAKELVLILDMFPGSTERTSGIHEDKDKAPGLSLVLETLRSTLTDYQNRFEDTYNEEAQDNLADANKELNDLHTKYADRGALVDTLKVEVQDGLLCCNKENMHTTESENEIQKLTKAYHKDAEEKLTSLHTLYQHLGAGSGLKRQPEGKLELFSWSEICAILQEKADAPILDLERANEKTLEEIAKKNEEKFAKIEEDQEQLKLENAYLKNTLSQTQKERTSLLAACALMAGALFPLYSRIRALCIQRDFLQDQLNKLEFLKQVIRNIIRIFSEAENQGENEMKKPTKSLLHIFRKVAICVMAANRLRCSVQKSNFLFSWEGNFHGGKEIRVSIGESDVEPHLSAGNQNTQICCNQVLKWFSSIHLLSAITKSMTELQEVIIETDPNRMLNEELLISKAKNSFAKLMDILGLAMENGQTVDYKEQGNLLLRLNCGLQKINAQAMEDGLDVPVPVMNEVSEFISKLLSGLTEFKQNLNEVKKELDINQSLELKSNESEQSKLISSEEDVNECMEPNNPVCQEQQTKLLLSKLSQQLQELNHQEELPSGEKDQNQILAEAIEGLSKAKMELSRKDQSLDELNRRLTQLEQDKRRLEESIHDAESALCIAAKDKEYLADHMKSVEKIFLKVTDQISLSHTAADTSDYTLKLPKLHLETLAMKGLQGGPEVDAFQGMIRCFMDIYEFASSRTAGSSEETTSYQNNTESLKSESRKVDHNEKESLHSVNPCLI